MARKNVKDERTLQMMDKVVELRREGYSIQEIADKYQLSDWTVYNYLGDAAAKAGINRDDLLYRPRSKDIAPRKTEAKREDDEFDMEAFEKKRKDLENRLTVIRKDLAYVIETNEKFLHEMEGKNK